MDDGGPEPFAFFPGTGVDEVAETVEEGGVAADTAEDGVPGVELVVGLPVAVFHLGGGHEGMLEDGVAGIVEVPVAGPDAAGGEVAVVESSTGIRGQDVKGGGFDAIFDSPFDGCLKYGRVIFLQAKDETGIDHDTEVVEAVDYRFVVGNLIVVFVVVAQGFLVQ